jgi:hypothetical protein
MDTNLTTITTRLVHLIRSQFLGLLALGLVLTGGAAYAAAAKDSVTSKSIRNGAVRTLDLADKAVTTPKIAPDAVTSEKVADGSLTGADIADGSVTGDDVDESSLGTVANAANLGGASASSYARSSVYKKEAATDAGTTNGDGSSTKTVGCDAGDILLSGGPASLLATSDVIESFPTPGSTNSWTARVDKNGLTDSWTVVILCLNQA